MPFHRKVTNQTKLQLFKDVEYLAPPKTGWAGQASIIPSGGQ